MKLSLNVFIKFPDPRLPLRKALTLCAIGIHIAFPDQPEKQGLPVIVFDRAIATTPQLQGHSHCTISPFEMIWIDHGSNVLSHCFNFDS